MEDTSLDLQQALLLKDINSSAEIVILDTPPKVVEKSHLDKKNERYAPENSMDGHNFCEAGNTEANTQSHNALKNQRIFPVFSNHGLAKLSVNYFLYFEFYYMAIRMLIGTFLLSVIIYIVQLITLHSVSDSDALGAKTVLFFITFVSLGVLLAYLRLIEEKRLLGSPILYDYQWSENLFSLLVEGLPKDVTEEEVINYFTAILAEKNANCGVKAVVLLQDCQSYQKLKQRLAVLDNKIKKLSSKGSTKESNLTSLKREKEELKTQIDKLQAEFDNARHFKGKAIVIFENIGAKITIIEHFNINIFKRIGVFCFRSIYKNYYLCSNRITIDTLPEPENLIFENLHYSWLSKTVRFLIAYSLSLFSFMIILGILLYEQVIKFIIAHEGSNVDFEEKSTWIIYTAIIIVLKSLSETLFLWTKGLVIDKSTLESDINRINFNIYISIVLYFIFQLVPASDLNTNWTVQLIKTSAVYLVTKVLWTCFAILMVHLATKYPYIMESTSLKHRIVKTMAPGCKKFDFVKGVNAGVPIMFTAFAFICLEPLLLLPTMIVVLYVLALTDKYRMTRYCDPLMIRSPKYMLAGFKTYRLALILVLLGGSCVSTRKSEKNDIGVNLDDLSPTLSSLLGLFTLFCLLYWPKTIDVRSKIAFNKKHEKTHYDSVSKEFASHYSELIPYSEATNKWPSQEI